MLPYSRVAAIFAILKGGVGMASMTVRSGAGVTVVTQREMRQMTGADTQPSTALQQAIAKRNAKAHAR
ncbi:hypothetical protein BST44_02650 [Mycobacterium scrofulaceum]|uniref:Uncharacterized protein n=1 Tax=Mycobacterium scrofulaceum TaxID=1783 RepID=A0A1X0KL18_MYCSC|nr:hypothetical protein BST44_02650 [Mycobacterium scrofulaceum]